MAESSLAGTYAVSGEREKAVEMLHDLLERKKMEYVSPYAIALIHFALGENDAGFEWLDQAYNERSTWMTFTKVHIRRNHIPYEPRTVALLKKLNLPLN